MVGQEESTHLFIRVTVLLDDTDPRQHVLSSVCLEQILTVGGGEPQDVLAPRVAVGDVNQTGLDADSQRVLVRLRILPVLVQAEGVTL